MPQVFIFEPEVFRCTKCKETFKEKRFLIDHRSTCPKREQIWKCSLCKVSFSESKAEEHFLKVHGKMKYQKNELDKMKSAKNPKIITSPKLFLQNSDEISNTILIAESIVKKMTQKTIPEEINYQGNESDKMKSDENPQKS